MEERDQLVLLVNVGWEGAGGQMVQEGGGRRSRGARGGGSKRGIHRLALGVTPAQPASLATNRLH